MLLRLSICAHKRKYTRALPRPPTRPGAKPAAARRRRSRAALFEKLNFKKLSPAGIEICGHLIYNIKNIKSIPAVGGARRIFGFFAVACAPASWGGNIIYTFGRKHFGTDTEKSGMRSCGSALPVCGLRRRKTAPPSGRPARRTCGIAGRNGRYTGRLGILS